MRYRIRPYSILSVVLFALGVFALGFAIVGIAYAVVFLGGLL